MNENLNLVDILKDCPRGTKLYSTIHGEVEFEKFLKGNLFPIHCIYDGSFDCFFNAEGKSPHSKVNGECVLFPSKDQRDWSKFSIGPEMVDGEIYYAQTNLVEWVYIYRRNNTFKTNHYVAVLNDYLMESNNVCTTYDDDIRVLRKATEEEKQSFFEAIEKNGLKWDADKKELVRIEKKFDISTLQPFDKVLCRINNNLKWCCDFFSYIYNDYYKFICIGGAYIQCVPYNDETKHLVGTNEISPKKYITWEE